MRDVKIDNLRKKKIAFMKWFPYDKRNEAISSSIGADCFFIHCLKKKTKWNAAIRYILQFIKTILVLRRARAEVIFITNPPILAAATVSLYCLMSGAYYIIDSHSGAFDKRWEFLKPLHKLISRKARLNIVTNQTYEKVYKDWGAKTFILSDLVFYIPKKQDIRLGNQFNIVIITSFSPDEPIQEIIAAARELPKVTFYMTGDVRKGGKVLPKDKPANLILTGFLPDQDFFDTLHASDAIMVLVDRDNTMQQGAYEALSVRKPMILSDWNVLKQTYRKGTVFVKNNRDSIKEGIRMMVDNYDTYKEEIHLVFEERKKIWDEKCQYLKNLIG